MKKLLGLVVLAGAATTMAACKKEAAFELKADTTVTEFMLNPHSVTNADATKNYIGFATVTTTAEGKIKSVNIDEVQPASAWNHNVTLARFNTPITKLAATEQIKIASCDSTAKKVTADTLIFAKYIKIGANYYVGEEAATAITCGTNGTETYKPFGGYFLADAKGVKTDVNAVALGFNAENMATMGAALIGTVNIQAPDNDGNLVDATTVEAGGALTKLTLSTTKKGLGYGSATYNYGASMARIESYVYNNAQTVANADYGTYGVTSSDKTNAGYNAASDELKATTGATATHTNNYLILAQGAVKKVIK